MLMWCPEIEAAPLSVSHADPHGPVSKRLFLFSAVLGTVLDITHPHSTWGITLNVRHAFEGHGVDFRF